MTTVCLLGCGALARVFAQNLNNVFHGSVTLVGAYCRTPDACRTFAENFGCRAAASLEELLTLNPDYVVEFAGGGAVRTSAETILEKTNLITASVGAWADPDFFNRAKATAKRCGTRLFIPNGAVGGLDLLQTYALMGDAHLTIENEKAPKSLNGAPYLAGRTLSETAAETVFTGSVVDARGTHDCLQARSRQSEVKHLHRVERTGTSEKSDVRSRRVLKTVRHIEGDVHQVLLFFVLSRMNDVSRPCAAGKLFPKSIQ